MPVFKIAPQSSAKPVSSPQKPMGGSEHEESLCGAVIATSERKGHTRGEAWTQYGIKIGGSWVNHWSAKCNDFARMAKVEGWPVRARFIRGRFGFELVSIDRTDTGVVL